MSTLARVNTPLRLAMIAAVSLLVALGVVQVAGAAANPSNNGSGTPEVLATIDALSHKWLTFKRS
jgi:hypothetical protein